ncbi:uncharacterized protein LOC135950577 [Calliphora vicina]|uniref:uncharacterized protein LOC135950575 n=1 Tax=Calliphora vicina TaxID=7373 RepID=UPI00325B1305
MIDIEAILNSRPISPLSSDPSDFEALTPGHFLIGAPLRSLPERDVPPIEINKLEYWARISAIKQQFWKKWSHDYINELQTRNKWTSTNSNICTGSLVIIKEDNLPPQRWLMGKIINIVRGRDDRQHSSTLSVFVGNRVSEIQDLTTGCIWRHVPTHFNPADIVSRGSTVEELASSIWFNGPAFLTLNPSKWPPNKIDQLSIENQQDIDREKRKTVLSLEATSNYILDSPQELENALLRIVFNLQQHHFQDDIQRALKKNYP